MALISLHDGTNQLSDLLYMVMSGNHKLAAGYLISVMLP